MAAGRVDGLSQLATSISLFPNPFGKSAVISYELRQSGPVAVRVYNQRGRLVRVVVQGSWGTPGLHRQQWDGLDDSGLPSANGVYLIELRVGELAISKPVTLLR